MYILLGSFYCNSEKLDRAAGLFDLFDCRLGSAGNFESDLCLQLAVGENANAVLGATDDAGSLESCSIDRCGSVKLLGVDGGLNAAERYDNIFGSEDVVETALRQTTVDWHLTAFKTVDGDARTSLLTLHTATTGLALARTDTATYADTVLGGAFVVSDFIEFHDRLLRLTSRQRRERDAGPHGSCREPQEYLPGCADDASC
ncbi:hypothetical protein AGR4C_Cc120038 [Agrobacterium tumefaciens str. Kerr 14]|uniref:Uncharacterized protein n=1 Tax=Agrobacterium tumefaciens str. Kerr 14 TaxID=1183424 RepID=A0A1S7NP20_AGRTU|nr:hypothetical protein AGR4C_Cc120038 [Agrobacterium tumefaciens str. Kerr 14]